MVGAEKASEERLSAAQSEPRRQPIACPLQPHLPQSRAGHGVSPAFGVGGRGQSPGPGEERAQTRCPERGDCTAGQVHNREPCSVWGEPRAGAGGCQGKKCHRPPPRLEGGAPGRGEAPEKQKPQPEPPAAPSCRLPPHGGAVSMHMCVCVCSACVCSCIVCVHMCVRVCAATP